MKQQQQLLLYNVKQTKKQTNNKKGCFETIETERERERKTSETNWGGTGGGGDGSSVPDSFSSFECQKGRDQRPVQAAKQSKERKTTATVWSKSIDRFHILSVHLSVQQLLLLLLVPSVHWLSSKSISIDVSNIGGSRRSSSRQSTMTSRSSSSNGTQWMNASDFIGQNVFRAAAKIRFFLSLKVEQTKSLKTS